MHEMSIASALVEQVLRIAAEENLSSIAEIELDVGALQLVVPEALDFAFKAASESTLAQGARLRQKEVPLMVHCRGCGTSYETEIHVYLCPQCGLADVEITAGRDIILRSLSGPENEPE